MLGQKNQVSLLGGETDMSASVEKGVSTEWVPCQPHLLYSFEKRAGILFQNNEKV